VFLAGGTPSGMPLTIISNETGGGRNAAAAAGAQGLGALSAGSSSLGAQGGGGEGASLRHRRPLTHARQKAVDRRIDLAVLGPGDLCGRCG
jgi:hypothetical protein